MMFLNSASKEASFSALASSVGIGIYSDNVQI